MGVEQLFQEVLAGRSICLLATSFLVLSVVMFGACLLCCLFNPAFKGSPVSMLSCGCKVGEEDERNANDRFWSFARRWSARVVLPLALAGIALKAVGKLFPTDNDLKTIGAYRAVKEVGDSASFNAAMSTLIDSWAVKDILLERYEKQQTTEPGGGEVPQKGSEAGEEAE